MDVPDLVHALLSGDLRAARQWVADAQRVHLRWECLDQPDGLDDREMSVAAAVIELLACRAGSVPPPWTRAVGGVQEVLVLDPGLEHMPRSFARAKIDAPEPLRRRNIITMPDFLDVA